eukprot:m.321210 g.321210  ORF g.321210 m.321210 type:complete len:285 (+) comp25115_c0_seq1:29-883(+)
MSAVTEESSAKCFGTDVKIFKHQSEVLKCEMKFAAILPEQISQKKVPVLFFLSGLTCNEQNFITKAGAQRSAAEHGIAIICPDTSPRVDIEGDSESWDFGKGAGFYVDATEEKWKTHYNMYSYITKELVDVVAQTFNVDVAKLGVFGHSMGGHGALVCALRSPGVFKSVSAFAPICHPCKCPWGDKAFSGYLGPDKETWKAYDATELAKVYDGPQLSVLIDQGKADKFLENQLKPQDFVRACAEAGTRVGVVLRSHDGYDHSYYFISTFVADHIKHHAEILSQK